MLTDPTRRAVDQDLGEHEEQVRRIAFCLLALENHPGRVVLDCQPLSGASGALAHATRATIAALHRMFESYQRVVSRARELRERRARPTTTEIAELVELFGGSSVDLSGEELPLERRTLLGPSRSCERVSLHELLARMERAFTEAAVVLAAIDRACTAVADQLDSPEGELNELEHALAEAGIAPPDLVEVLACGPVRTPRALRDELAALRRAALVDPLAPVLDRGTGSVVDRDRVAGLRADIALLRSRLDAVVALRADVGARRAQVCGVIAHMQHVQAEQGRLHAVVGPTDLSARLPQPRLHGPDLLRRLDAAIMQAGAGRWGAAAAAIAAVERAARDERDRVEADRDHLAGLLKQRAELRGRLRAYRAKARSVGKGHRGEINAAARQAEALLCAVPCDLASTTRAVRHVQQLVLRDDVAVPGPTEEMA